MHVLTAKYALGQRVVIPDLDKLKTVVTAIMWSAEGNQYRVAWFNNGVRVEHWLNEYEIAEAK